ncbi:MAG: substrate-binding domain-containing protein [Nostocoides sp.]
MASVPWREGVSNRSESEFRVALVLPRHGPAGIFGLECLAAAELAAAEVDAAGGVAGRSISYVEVDAGGEPDAVGRHIKALLDANQIDAVTGWHLSNVRQSIARVVQGRIPYVYAAAYEGGERHDGVLCSGEVPGDQILASLDWFRTELRLRRWYLIGNDYVWPRETAARTHEGLCERDAEIVRQRFVPLGTEDPIVWASVLEDIRSSGARGVITLLVGSDAVRFNRAFASADMAGAIIRFSPFIDETVVLATGPEATANLFVSAGWFSSLRTASANEFSRNFKRAWDLVCGTEPLVESHAPEPGTMAETTYSGVHLLTSIAGRTIPTVPDTRRAFHSWAWDSPHGTVELHAGAARHPVHLAAANGVGLDVVAQVSTGGR